MNGLPIRHFAEARRNVLQRLETLVAAAPIRRALLSPDIFARIRVALWADDERAAGIAALEAELSRLAGPFWGGLWVVGPATPAVDRDLLEELWNEGAPYSDAIRLNERHRSLSGWLEQPFSPPWAAGSLSPVAPPIVSFYAFKGGAGRSTALAIFASQRARAGERVAALDLDFAAPGLGPLLIGDVAAAQYGIVDYWLERPLLGEAIDLRDYYTRVADPAVIGAGEIFVFPAGSFDDAYLLKLARLDFTPPADGEHPLITLLQHIRAELQPHWILLDARAGLSEAAGFALGGLAHLNILFGNASAASWHGLRLAVRRLGAERAWRGLPQEQCLLVHSMAPANPQTAQLAQTEFLRYAQQVFEQEYYLPDPEDPDDDSQWYLRDMENRDAPHVPVTLFYSERIAFFVRLPDLIDYGVNAADYRELGERITSRFPRESGV